MDPERLKFEPLPPGQGGSPEALWGLKAANPKASVGQPRTTSSSAAAAGDTAPGHREGALLPRNRELIEKYFDSK